MIKRGAIRGAQLRERGFTLVESLMACALLALVSILVSSFFVGSMKATQQAQSILAGSLDKAVTERIVWRDFRGVNPSFNNLRTLDDTGKLFFDYLSDGRCSVDCGRIYTISSNVQGPHREFIFVKSAQEVAAPEIFPIEGAYNVTPPPADDPSVSGTLAFNSINKNGLLDHQVFPSSRAPEFKLNNQILMFYTFSDLHDPKISRVNPAINYWEKPARSLVYFGTYKHSDSSMSMLLMNGMINNTYPGDSDIEIDDQPVVKASGDAHAPNNFGANGIDKFFRMLPPVNGAVAVAYVRPVEFIRYALDESGNLWKSSSMDPETWKSLRESQRFLPLVDDKNKRLVSPRVDEVYFRRDNITLPTIGIRLVMKSSLDKIKDESKKAKDH